MNPSQEATPVDTTSAPAPASTRVLTSTPASGSTPTPTPAATVSSSAADRFMRKLLRIKLIDKSASNERAAHRNFRTSLVISGIRCLISYLVVPILVPIIGFAGIVTAPIGIALCLIAVVNGIYALRRFWSSNHRMRWMYTWFIAVVFVILAIAMVSDILRITGA